MPTFYEFFAGAGMARAGLGERWKCLLANDFDPKKAAAYRRNWGHRGLLVGDISRVTSAEVPKSADLAWASFPCQDLSLAGAGAGLKGDRSGTFWPFCSIIEQLADERRAPRVVALENVCGALTSHGGKDFTAIVEALVQQGYRVGAVVMDAVNFVPQSRPRLFVIGVRDDVKVPSELETTVASNVWHTTGLIEAFHRLPPELQEQWIWWHMPPPNVSKRTLADLVGDTDIGVAWHSAEQTTRLLNLMNELHLEKVRQAQKSGKRVVGTIYRRTRPVGDGRAVRAEVRFDGIAGCLRTPTGGSSRQIIIVVEGSQLRTRLLSAREAARLMGLEESFVLPENYNDAYHLVGDGVVVPVVRHLANHIIEPLIRSAAKLKMAA